MTSFLRRALSTLLPFVLAGGLVHWSAGHAAAQPRSAPAKQRAEPEFPRLDDALQGLEREPVLLVAEGLEPLVEPAALRARLAALFGRPVVSLADPEAASALATLYCSRADARAPAARRGFITLRLSTQGADLWQRIPAQNLSGDALSAIANAVLDMLWSDRIASLGDPELLDPFCPPGLTCVDKEHPSWRLHAARGVAESSLVDPWDAREPRFTLLESRAYWTRGDPWGTPAAKAATAPAKPAPARPDAGASRRSDRAH